jgi:hypothetical protein
MNSKNDICEVNCGSTVFHSILDNNRVVDNIDDTRTIDNQFDTFRSTERTDNCKETDSKRTDIGNINIFRYKFADCFTDELFKFSKIHQYDDRKTFKEAWTTWTEENNDLVNTEFRRLSNLGYDGDILDKMFKSARYYFRKKSTEKKEPAKRRIYVGIQKEFLDAMDEHIKSNMNSGQKENDNEVFKPSTGFDDFCKNNFTLLKDEIAQLCRAGMTDSNEIKNKIKKTYKNRYFLVVSK